MKILLVNNHTVHLNSLAAGLAGHDLEVQFYKPGIKFNDTGKDLVILSGGGGEGLEIDDEYEPGRLWYNDEMEFVRTTKQPVIGICMGFEVIAKAYGAPVTSAGGLIYSRENLELSKTAKGLFHASSLSQYEAHSWLVEDVPSDFEVLATSKKNGRKKGIEAFRYDKYGKSIFATQFHPEKGGTLNLQNLIFSLT
jgi:GMP synthase-like glutamine amidotransferase